MEFNMDFTQWPPALLTRAMTQVVIEENKECKFLTSLIFVIKKNIQVFNLQFFL